MSDCYASNTNDRSTVISRAIRPASARCVSRSDQRASCTFPARFQAN